MNKEQRNTLNKYALKLDQMTDAYEEIRNGVEAIKEEEEEKQNNTSNLSDTLADIKYDEYQEYIDALDEALDLFEEINFSEIAEQLRSI